MKPSEGVSSAARNIIHQIFRDPPCNHRIPNDLDVKCICCRSVKNPVGFFISSNSAGTVGEAMRFAACHCKIHSSALLLLRIVHIKLWWNKLLGNQSFWLSVGFNLLWVKLDWFFKFDVHKYGREFFVASKANILGCSLVRSCGLNETSNLNSSWCDMIAGTRDDYNHLSVQEFLPSKPRSQRAENPWPDNVKTQSIKSGWDRSHGTQKPRNWLLQNSFFPSFDSKSSCDILWLNLEFFIKGFEEDAFLVPFSEKSRIKRKDLNVTTELQSNIPI